jgi:hypothetical protein
MDGVVTTDGGGGNGWGPAVVKAEGGSGGRQEKFCDVVLKFCDVDLLLFFNNYFVIWLCQFWEDFVIIVVDILGS